MTTLTKLPWATLVELNGQRASLAERLTPEELDALHINTKLDDAIVVLARENKRVYLTGNPGDGKTHLIRRHKVELDQLGALMDLDASAVNEAQLLALIQRAIDEDRPAVIAINEGPLRSLKDRLPEPDRTAVKLQLETPFLYQDESDEDHKAVVLNLGERQVLTRDIFSTAVRFVVQQVDYSNAPAGMVANIKALTSERVKERLTLLMQMVLQSGGHVTMHELLGFLAFIVTQDQTTQNPPRYSELVFDPRNPLHKLLAPFDPVRLPHALIDMELWDGNRSAQQWLEMPDLPVPAETDDNIVALRSFQQLKRRYYFEGKSGEGIYKALPKDQQEFYEKLQEAEHHKDAVLNALLQAVAHYFGDRDSNGEELPVWTSLRYEAYGPATAFLSSQSISKKDLRIALPRLRSQQAAWLSYQPTHIRLIARHTREVSFDVDLEVWKALRAIQNGMPQRFHDLVVGRRLNEFMSQLDKQLQATRQRYFPMVVRDVNNPAQPFRIYISTEHQRYEL